MGHFVWYLVLIEVGLDFSLVISEITQGIKYLSQGEVGQVGRNLFGRNPKAPEFNNRAYRSSCPTNDGFTVKDGALPDNVVVLSDNHNRHAYGLITGWKP